MKRDHVAVLLVGGLLVIGLAIVAAGFGSVAADPAGESNADRTIDVSASGGADAPPDQGRVRIAVTDEGASPSVVRDDLARGAADLREELDALDVEYETVQYSVDEPYRRPDEEERPAYQGVHAFEVTVDDPDRVGAVIDAAADVEAEIAHVELTLSESSRNELRDEAIANAMADARHQANAVAAAADLDVEGVKRVDASQSRYRPVRDAALAATPTPEDGAPSTGVDYGEVTVTYDVAVTYNATLSNR